MIKKDINDNITINNALRSKVDRENLDLSEAQNIKEAMLMLFDRITKVETPLIGQFWAGSQHIYYAYKYHDSLYGMILVKSVFDQNWYSLTVTNGVKYTSVINTTAI